MNNQFSTLAKPFILKTLHGSPQACAAVFGDPDNPEIHGTVQFYQTGRGVLLYADISGLPHSNAACASRIFGFHIHEGRSCTGTAAEPFADTKSHDNPQHCPHPFHAGDLPPLFENDGHAVMLFLTDRFTVCDVIGKTVVIHDQPDDFNTQPAGNSGMKIACGVIRSSK